VDVFAIKRLCVGAWSVDPSASQISRDGEVVRLEARTMGLLLFLVERAGRVVSIDELLENVWPGVIVTQDSVYQAVASLRRVLGDDPKQPKYIATVPRQGYRLVAAISPWFDAPKPAAPTPATAAVTGRDAVAIAPAVVDAAPAPAAFTAVTAAPIPQPLLRPQARSKKTLIAAVGVAVSVALIGVVFLNIAHRSSSQSTATARPSPAERSIGVLPFLDLTSEEMTKEYFADAMTEELIDRLGKIPGMRIPSATASFYFKDQKMPPAEIAKRLGVSYLLDGSIRKSGTTMRVAARLVRADTGFVVWSETYDRPSSDELTIQDDIAAQVTKAIRVSVDQDATR
jgi:transcriptional activator of cad operon